MGISLAILNNLVLTMSSQIGNTLAKRRMQKLENLHYYVLGTLFPLPVHLVDDQHGEFLKSWMAYQEFDEFPNIIEYYTTIGNGTLLKEEYTTIKESTLLKDIEHFLYLTQLYFSNDTPNQIPHLMSTLILWSKTFYTTIGQYPTLYDYLTITRHDLICWEYHPDNPYTSPIPKVVRFTLKLPLVYCGDVENSSSRFYLISCSQGILNSSRLLLLSSPKIACLHVSFTAYENFYKLSKMHCHLVLTFLFLMLRMSECRNPTIKHISTYTLVSSSITTYVTDLFLGSKGLSKCDSTHIPN